MGKIIDITGQRFGRLLVIYQGERVRGLVSWLCACQCGNKVTVPTGCLRSGNTTSCGCYTAERRLESCTKHGLSRHPAYQSWRAMKGRCGNPEFEGYEIYGGRGITYTPAWETFEGFWRDMEIGWWPGMSIDRKDTDGNYEPGNCKWSTPKEQANNRRDNVVVTLPDGQKMNITQAADYYGLDRRAVYARIRYGWPETDWFKPTRNRTPKGMKK